MSIIECEERVQDVQKLHEGVKLIPNIDRKPVLCHSFDTSTLQPDLKVEIGCFSLPNQKLFIDICTENDVIILFIF